jgi:RNA polymerase sigma-70 factor (ECF subfamily)
MIVTEQTAARDLVGTETRIRVDEPAREEAVSDRDRPDAALVDAARNGSEEALEALFRRHWRAAHRAAYLVCLDRSAAEDIAQEAFLAAVRSLHRFDQRRPFGPWLHRIVVNRAIDWTRRPAARRELPAAALSETITEPWPEPGHESGRAGELLPALATLAPDHRAVIVLRYVYDLSPGEIARALGVPRGTVNSRLRRGLDQLGRQLDREAIR